MSLPPRHEEFTPFDFVPSHHTLYGEIIQQDSSGETQSAYQPTPHPMQGPKDPPIVQNLLSELRTLAALESSIYLARSLSRSSVVALHTPARRLARTIVTFGVDDGVAFGLRALRAIEAVVDGCRDNVRGLCFWWSNCVQLRWMLWAMCGACGCTSPVLCKTLPVAVHPSSLHPSTPTHPHQGVRMQQTQIWETFQL